MNKGYWMMKNMGSTNVWSGWRYYMDGETVTYSADAGVAAYTMYDFGLVEPEWPAEEITDEEEGDGASTLISSAALALAAFLMF